MIAVPDKATEKALHLKKMLRKVLVLYAAYKTDNRFLFLWYLDLQGSFFANFM